MMLKDLPCGLKINGDQMNVSRDNKDAVVVQAIMDCEQLEAMKAKYLKHCFKAAKADLAQGNVVDGETFISML